MALRLAVLYAHPGSYTRACLQALKEKHGWEILAMHYRRSGEAPFAEEPLAGIAELVDRGKCSSGEEIAQRVRSFGAEAVLMSGWMDKGYLAAARSLRKEGIPVIAGSDTQWTGSLRQRIATLVAPFFLKPAIDVLWVTGNRQEWLARRLGYRGERCWKGMYCCDWSAFANAGDAAAERERAFLFVGRYIPVKGIDLLLDAYARYRSASEAPWALKCAGAGDLAGELAGVEGVADLGFIQPASLPALMARCGAFVLPSRKEPWGVVVQEAAAAKMPVICSSAVGAGDHLVEDGHNGFVFESGDASQLAECLARLASLSEEDRVKMGEASRELSRRYLPETWAETLVKGIEAWNRSSQPAGSGMPTHSD